MKGKANDNGYWNKKFQIINGERKLIILIARKVVYNDASEQLTFWKNLCLIFIILHLINFFEIRLQNPKLKEGNHKGINKKSKNVVLLHMQKKLTVSIISAKIKLCRIFLTNKQKNNISWKLFLLQRVSPKLTQVLFS